MAFPWQSSSRIIVAGLVSDPAHNLKTGGVTNDHAIGWPQLILLYPITSVVEIAMVPSGYVVSSGRNELVRCVAVGESHCDIYGEGDRIAEPYAATRR